MTQWKLDFSFTIVCGLLSFYAVETSRYKAQHACGMQLMKWKPDVFFLFPNGGHQICTLERFKHDATNKRFPASRDIAMDQDPTHSQIK